MSNQAIYTFIGLLLLFSCSDSNKLEKPETIYKNGVLESTILIPAGETYPPFEQLEVPPFFNVGKVTHDNSKAPLKTIILSQRLNKGQKVSVKPLSLFSFTTDTIEHRYLVSSYITVDNNRLGDNFSTFMSINNDLQMAIEYWFRAQCGLEKCNSYRWSQAYKAIRELR